MLLEQVHTDSTEDAGDANKVVVQFQAVAVDVPDLESARDYYLTAGVEYGNEQYVWVGQAHIRTIVVASRVSASRDNERIILGLLLKIFIFFCMADVKSFFIRLVGFNSLKFYPPLCCTRIRSMNEDKILMDGEY